MGYLSDCFKLIFLTAGKQKTIITITIKKSVELTGYIKMFGGFLYYLLSLFFKRMF